MSLETEASNIRLPHTAIFQDHLTISWNQARDTINEQINDIRWKVTNLTINVIQIAAQLAGLSLCYKVYLKNLVRFFNHLK